MSKEGRKEGRKEGKKEGRKETRRHPAVMFTVMGAAMIGTMYFLRANCAQHGGSASSLLSYRALGEIYTGGDAPKTTHPAINKSEEGAMHHFFLWEFPILSLIRQCQLRSAPPITRVMNCR